MKETTINIPAETYGMMQVRKDMGYGSITATLSNVNDTRRRNRTNSNSTHSWSTGRLWRSWLRLPRRNATNSGKAYRIRTTALPLNP
jgi:hypothetical protein